MSRNCHRELGREWSSALPHWLMPGERVDAVWNGIPGTFDHYNAANLSMQNLNTHWLAQTQRSNAPFRFPVPAPHIWSADRSAVCAVAAAGSGTPPDDDSDSRSGIVTKPKPKTKKPSLYKVLLLNDDYTPMDFVVLVLERFFNKSREEATRIMLHVHQKGVGICGVYTYEIAETKVARVMSFARQNQHPLQCTMEKE
jgi:ATP-dependent Clp protease adaptor protein ClpS